LKTAKTRKIAWNSNRLRTGKETTSSLAQLADERTDPGRELGVWPSCTEMFAFPYRNIEHYRDYRSADKLNVSGWPIATRDKSAQFAETATVWQKRGRKFDKSRKPGP